MMRPTKPSRVPSKSPTLMGRFFLWAIRPLAAAKNSQKTMTGQKTIAACPKSSMIELSALEPLRPIRSARDFVAYVCGWGAGLDALGSGLGRLPGRLPGAHQTSGVTARCPGEGAVTGCHVTAPRFVAAVWPRSGSLVAGVPVVGDLAVVGCGAVQLSCWASRFKNNGRIRVMRISNPLVAGSQGQMLRSQIAESPGKRGNFIPVPASRRQGRRGCPADWPARAARPRTRAPRTASRACPAERPPRT